MSNELKTSLSQCIICWRLKYLSFNHLLRDQIREIITKDVLFSNIKQLIQDLAFKYQQLSLCFAVLPMEMYKQFKDIATFSLRIYLRTCLNYHFPLVESKTSGENFNWYLELLWQNFDFVPIFHEKSQFSGSAML